MTPTKSTRAMDGTIKELQKEYGDRTVVRLGDTNMEPIEGISTGVFSLDLALGGKGFPRGRICEVFGPPSNGKTAVLQSTAAAAQRSNVEVVWIDAELTFDPDWGKKFGMDVEKLILVQPDYGEQAFDIIENFIAKGADMVVVDSVEGLVPRAELEGEMGESHMGLKARMMGQALRKLVGVTSKSKTALVFINQLRIKLGAYGNPEVTPGGEALKYWSSVRLDVRKVSQGTIKEGDKIVGMRIRAKAVKNKCAPPFGEGEFDLYTGACECHPGGIDRGADLLDVAVAHGVVDKQGAWYSFAAERIGQGRENAAKFLTANQPVFVKVVEAVFKARDKK